MVRYSLVIDCMQHFIGNYLYIFKIGKAQTGRNGDDIFVRVPLGTVVRSIDPYADENSMHNDMLNGDQDYIDSSQYNERNVKKSADFSSGYEEDLSDEDVSDNGHLVNNGVELNNPNEILLVAHGGKPGTGNSTLIGAKNRQRSLPATKLPGHEGQQRSLMLELKTIADVGLIGYPNVGGNI